MRSLWPGDPGLEKKVVLGKKNAEGWFYKNTTTNDDVYISMNGP